MYKKHSFIPASRMLKNDFYYKSDIFSQNPLYPPGLNFSFGKIFHNVVSAISPKRVLGFTRAITVTPLRVGSALLRGKPVRPILKAEEKHMRESGALPGDTKKVAAVAAPVVSAIGTVLSFTPLAPLGIAMSLAGAAVGTAVKIQGAKQAKRMSENQIKDLENQYNKVYEDYVKDTQNKGFKPIDKTTFDKLVNESMYGPSPNVVSTVSAANSDFSGPPPVSDGKVIPPYKPPTGSNMVPVATMAAILLSGK